MATAAGTLAAAVALAGCGGDDSTIESVSVDTDSTTAAVSTDEFITAADALCAEANAAIANLSTDPAVSASSTQQQLDITTQTLEGLQALGSPDDPDGTLSEFYTAVEDQISALKDREDALASGDTAAENTADIDLEDAESKAQVAGESFGFDECGQEGAALAGDSTTPTTPPPATTTAPPAPTTPTTPAPVTPAPVDPAPTPTPEPAPPSGGGIGGGGGGGGGGGSSGGISP